MTARAVTVRLLGPWPRFPELDPAPLDPEAAGRVRAREAAMTPAELHARYLAVLTHDRREDHTCERCHPG